MKLTRITDNGQWCYHVALAPVAALPGQHNLEISSQWLGARNPDHLVRQLQITLPTKDLCDLYNAIGAYLEPRLCVA